MDITLLGKVKHTFDLLLPGILCIVFILGLS